MSRKMIQAKHLPELALLEAIDAFHRLSRWGSVSPLASNGPPWVALGGRFPAKVIYAKMEKLERRGLIECGVSLRTGWLTDKGRARLAELRQQRKEEACS